MIVATWEELYRAECAHADGLEDQNADLLVELDRTREILAVARTIEPCGLSDRCDNPHCEAAVTLKRLFRELDGEAS